jgi:ankyrin repeat protein
LLIVVYFRVEIAELYKVPLNTYACFVGLVEPARELIDKGADVNTQDGFYGNALYAALFGGHLESIKLLLDKGADIHAQSGRYGNALQAASEGRHKEIVKLLLDNGADVHAQGLFL